MSNEQIKETENTEMTKDEDRGSSYDVVLPIPDYVINVLFKEMDELDKEIAKKTEELQTLNKRYVDISKFIKEYGRP